MEVIWRTLPISETPICERWVFSVLDRHRS